jgi:two-component system OmpR family response regulator
MSDSHISQTIIGQAVTTAQVPYDMIVSEKSNGRLKFERQRPYLFSSASTAANRFGTRTWPYSDGDRCKMLDGGQSEEPTKRWSDGEGRGGGRQVRVLVVDDDRSLQQMLANYLEKHDLRVALASQKHELMRQLAVGEPDIVILDLRLGQEDGLDLLRKIRSRSDVSVIITTGHRRDEIDRVVGLELGADDYITKPFSLRELLARIRAVLRRREAGRIVAERQAKQGRFRFGDWQLNRRLRRLTDPSDDPVCLTKGEYALLSAFLHAPQRPLTREQLLQATRIHEDVFDRSIDVQILRLRRKLEADPSAPSIIRTERGVGYVFTLPVEQL